LSSVICLGQNNVLVRVEDDQSITIIFALTAITEIIGVEGPTFRFNDYLLPLNVAAFSILSKPLKVFKVNTSIG
jgi:hypothetical protein